MTVPSFSLILLRFFPLLFPSPLPGQLFFHTTLRRFSAVSEEQTKKRRAKENASCALRRFTPPPSVPPLMFPLTECLCSSQCSKFSMGKGGGGGGKDVGTACTPSPSPGSDPPSPPPPEHSDFTQLPATPLLHSPVTFSFYIFTHFLCVQRKHATCRKLTDERLMK